MQARPGPAYKPEDFRRGYSRDQIVEHLSDALDIYRELADGHEIDAEIRPFVFSIITTMTAAVEPTEEALKKIGLRQTIVGGPQAPNGLGLVGQG